MWPNFPSKEVKLFLSTSPQILSYRLHSALVCRGWIVVTNLESRVGLAWGWPHGWTLAPSHSLDFSSMQPVSRSLERWEDSFRGLIPEDPCQEGWAPVVLGDTKAVEEGRGRAALEGGGPPSPQGCSSLPPVHASLNLVLQGIILRKEKNNVWDTETSWSASGWVPHYVSEAPSTCPSEEHLFPSGECWVPVWLVFMLEIACVRSKD